MAKSKWPITDKVSIGENVVVWNGWVDSWEHSKGVRGSWGPAIVSIA